MKKNLKEIMKDRILEDIKRFERFEKNRKLIEELNKKYLDEIPDDGFIEEFENE